MLVLILCMFIMHTTFTTQEPSIKHGLAPSNALFDRVIYEKDKKGEVQRETVNRTLLIFLDNSEYETKVIGTVTQAAIIALIEPVCPVLISVSLLITIFRLASTEGHFFQQICKSIVNIIESEKWISRKINDSSGMIVLIPKNYLKEKTISQNTNAFLWPLGLLVATQFPSEKIPFETALKEQYQNFIESTRSIEEDFSELIELMFLGNEAYSKKKDYSWPQWSIYMLGHGASGVSAAGLKLPYFKKFLDFLNTKITTKFFVYDTCFSAGKTQEDIYENAGKLSKKTYNFPIMSMGIVESPSFIKIDVTSLKDIPTISSYKSEIEFEQFIEQTASSEPVPYLKIAVGLKPSLNFLLSGESFSKEAAEVALSNFPLIRPANLDYFIPLIKTFNINENLIKTSTPRH